MEIEFYSREFAFTLVMQCCAHQKTIYLENNYFFSNKKTARKIINIDSEKIFRTAMDNSLIQGDLEKVVDLKEIK